jgi:hypothetical protein
MNRNALTVIALATTCLSPLAAFAADPEPNAGTPTAGAATPAPGAGSVPLAGVSFNGEIGLGVMGVMGRDADQAGRYSGLNTTGADGVAEFYLYGRSPWDSGQTQYYILTGDNLVYQGGSNLGTGNTGASDNQFRSSINNNWLNSGTVRLDVGQQGTWAAGAYYDAITYTGNVIDSIYTMHGSVGTLNGIPAFGGATATHAGPITAYTVPQLTASGAEQLVQTGTRRDNSGGDFKYILGDWTFSGAFRHETKDGSMEEAFISKYGGQAFAMPIDYTTDRYDASVAYNTRINQMILEYTYSKFVDGNTFFNLPQLVSMTIQPFAEAAAYSAPPSNEAHYITLLAATNAVPKTRINVNLRAGLELQDAAFAPDSADPFPQFVPGFADLNPALQGTTNNSLNASAFVYQGKISADSHPFNNADARVYYGFDGRQVNLDQYRVFSTNTGGEGDLSFNNPYFVVPQDWLKQDVGTEVGYRILPEYNTKVIAGYRFDDVNRKNAEVGNANTSTGSLALLSSLGPQINGKLAYEHSERSGVLNYVVPFANLAGVPATAANSGVTYSGAYYQAPMTSDAVKLRGDYTPIHNLSAGLYAQFKNENYTYPATTLANSGTTTGFPITGVGQGVKQDYNLTAGPDINYRPTEDSDVHFFYTYERIFFDSTGNGACSTAAEAATAACAGTAGYFQNNYTSAVNTLGVSGEWQINSKLKLGAEYTFSYGSVMFGEFNGVFVPAPTQSYQNVSNYPDINSVMHDAKLTATYELTPGLNLLAMVCWSYFRSNDWNDYAGPIQGAGTTAISYLTPGYEPGNYSIVTLMTGVKFKF